MKKVLLLYGGNSSEHEVSCSSANSIIENIDKTKYKLYCVKITQSNIWLENNKKIIDIVSYLKQFDVVFPIIHGSTGEDGKLQGMLDFLNIKYVGSKTAASAICMDKEYTKIMFDKLNIPQVPYIILKNGEKKIINIPFPLIVKPANGGSSIGISKANNKRELLKAIKLAREYDEKVIIEKFMQIRELECAVLEDKKIIASDVGEIKPANDFYDYDAKYKNEYSQVLIPAKIPRKIKKQIQDIAILLFKKLELKGLARVDFFYDQTNKKVFINEINTLPGFTEISMYPKLLIHSGLTYTDLITILIENA